MDTLEDLTAQIFVIFADIASTQRMFKRIRQSFAHRCLLFSGLRGCKLTVKIYVVSFDDVMHFLYCNPSLR